MNTKFREVIGKLNIMIFPTSTLFILIVFCSAILRFINLGVKSLWFDEAIIFHEAKLPLFKIFHDATIGGEYGVASEPFISYLVSHWFYSFTKNSSELFLRLPSCIFGIGSVILIYFLANLLFRDKKIAISSSLLVAISQFQIWESQQLRPYSMTMFLSLVLLFFFFKFFISRDDRDLVIFTAIAIFCSSVHYLIILLFAINILVAFRVVKDTFLNKTFDKVFIEKWVLSQLIIFSFCLIEYNLFIKRRLGFGSGDYLSHWYFQDSNIFQSFSLFFLRTLPLFLSYLPVSSFVFNYVQLMFLIGIISLWNKKNGKSFLILGIASFVLTYILALNKIYPYIFGKRTIFLSPFFYIIICCAYTTELFNNKKRNAVIACFLFMPLIINALQFSKNYLVSPFYPTYTGTTNGKFVIEIFKKEYRSNDYVYIIKPGILEFKYYFDCSQINCVYGGDNKLEDELELFLKNKGRKWIYLVQLPRDRMKEVIGFITKFASIDYFITDPPQYVMLILCR